MKPSLCYPDMGELQRWPSELPAPEALGFGQYLGPWVVRCEHTRLGGWRRPQLIRRAEADVTAASAAVQYGLSLFEGLKAHRMKDGSLALFRPKAHARRLRRGSNRLLLPELSEESFLEMCRLAVTAQADYVPAHGCGSMYLRPILYAADDFHGLRESQRHVFEISVSACQSPGFRHKRLWAETQYSRACPGGLGATKTAANYASSALGMRQAQQRGYDDALWLDAVEHRWIGEAGAMNLFAVIGNEVITPSLDGTILPGITRDSAIRWMLDQGQPVIERALSLQELAQACCRGELREVFGVGTAARVVPIDEIGWQGGSIFPSGGDMAERWSAALSGIQEGRDPDPYGWRASI